MEKRYIDEIQEFKQDKEDYVFKKEMEVNELTEVVEMLKLREAELKGILTQRDEYFNN